MKTGLKLIYLCSAALSIFGCGTVVPKRSGLNPAAIDSLHLVHLPSLIYTISKGDQGEFNPLYSDSSLLIRETIYQDLYFPPSVSLINFEIPEDEKHIYQQFDQLIREVENKRKIKGITLNDSIYHFLQEKNIRYALLTFNTGFSRDKGNMGKQVAKSIAIGVLSLGTIIPIPSKAYCTSIGLILDRENRNIAFYRRQSQEMEPLKPKYLKMQHKAIIKSYFKDPDEVQKW